MTRASRGTEHSLVVPSFEERRRIAQLNETLKQAANIGKEDVRNMEWKSEARSN